VALCIVLATVVLGCEDKSDQLRVTFDGETCTVIGPSQVPSGETFFILEDQNDLGASLYVSVLHDGYTFQDMVDLSDAAGGPGSYYPKPIWVENQRVIFASPPEELVIAENETYVGFFLKAGPNSVYVYANRGLWFCGPLDVTETESP
jgi:hypothetical protein